MTGCQTKKASTADNSTSSVTASKDTTESKSSDKSSSSKKDDSNSKPEIEELSPADAAKKLEMYMKRQINHNGLDNEIIFFKTPGSKESDRALKKFSETCHKVGKKLYTLDISTEEGKKVIEADDHINKTFDAVILKKNHIMYLDLPNDWNMPPKALKGWLDGPND